ncbi:Clavaminate synthase-like protein [Auricularia subglabra TFB-10046 SS5]|nr:Clavaminate synthase-like protein [Auricularia subglabra TFB-10046 SS5]
MQLPPTPHYEPASPTKEDCKHFPEASDVSNAGWSSAVAWADLPTVDLSLAGTPKGRKELVGIVKNAMRDHGFFYVINHGLTPDQNARMFDIADIPFSAAKEEDRQTYVAKMKQDGNYLGYKPRQYWHIDAGVRDQIEHYNINKDVMRREHPEALRSFIPEIEEFARFNHLNILHPLLRLFAGAVDLPEETFVDMHKFDASAASWIRFMNYPRNEEDERRTQQVWLKGHQDFGSVTILWSQPVTALQILGPDNTWRWVKHVPNALAINAGEALEALSGGRLRATIHRVVQPPKDQRGCERLGVFYFATTDDDVRLEPLVSGEGVKARFTGESVPTMKEWAMTRTRAYGQTQLKKAELAGVEEEVLNGQTVRHFN